MALSLAARPRSRFAIALCAGLLAVPSGEANGQLLMKPFAEYSRTALTLRDSVVEEARAQVGRRYKTGGATPDRGFDCSGLVKYVLERLRVEVPRTSHAQARIGAAIARDTTLLRPGDLLLFGKARAGVSHVGIYVGDGRYIHASSVAGRVIESRIDRPPSALIKVLMSARRVLAYTDTVPVAWVTASQRERQ